jgi:hypothetical protein
MNEHTSFGCGHENIISVQSDAACICAAISKVCSLEGVDIQWRLQKMLSNVVLSSNGFPEMQIIIEMQGGKINAKKDGAA